MRDPLGNAAPSEQRNRNDAGRANERSLLQRLRVFWGRVRIRKNPGGKLFWAWIAYQSIKGIITLSLIWIPLFLFWLNGR